MSSDRGPARSIIRADNGGFDVPVSASFPDFPGLRFFSPRLTFRFRQPHRNPVDLPASKTVIFFELGCWPIFHRGYFAVGFDRRCASFHIWVKKFRAITFPVKKPG